MEKSKYNKKNNPFIAIYHNEIQSVNFSMLSSLESNLLFSIFRYFNYGSSYVFTRKQLSLMVSNEGVNSNERIISTIKGLANKFLGTNIRIIKNNTDIYINLFSHMEVDTDNIQLTITLNPNLEWLFKDLKKQFTILDLVKFKSIKSTYAKIIFRYMCQYNNNKFFSMPLDKFKEMLNIPSSYLTGNIKQRVLNPTIKELSLYYKHISYKLDTKANTISFLWKNFITSDTPNNSFFVPNDINLIKATRKRLFNSLKYAEALKEEYKIKKIENTIKILDETISMV